MPRRAVDMMSVSALNRAVSKIEEEKRRPGLIRVGGVGGLALNVRRRDYASGTALSASWVLRRTFENRRRDFALSRNATKVSGRDRRLKAEKFHVVLSVQRERFQMAFH